MVVYIVGAVVDYLWLAIIMGAVPIISSVIFLFMPETPCYLLMRGDRDGAQSVLQYFRGVKYDVGPEIKMLQVSHLYFSLFLNLACKQDEIHRFSVSGKAQQLDHFGKYLLCSAGSTPNTSSSHCAMHDRDQQF